MQHTYSSPDQKSVAIFLPSLRGGGAERVMVQVANGLSDRGISVDLVLVKAEGPYLAEVDARVNIVNLNRERTLSALIPFKNYLRDNRPTAVLSALSHANIVAILSRGLTKTKPRLVISERNSPSGERNLGRSQILIRLLMRIFYRHADHIVAVSKGIQKELIADFGVPDHKVTTIYNPIDLEKILSLSKKPVEHIWLKDGRSFDVVVAVGRLAEQKDYPTLLRAIKLLRGTRDTRLIVLGDGPLKSDLAAIAQELQITDHVDWVGFQENPYAWLSRADIYVLSSRWEGLPNTLLQAVALGLPVVSTDCPTGPKEILEEAKVGLLVGVQEPNEMASAIAHLLEQNQCWNPASFEIEAFGPQHILESYFRVLLDPKFEEHL